MIKNALDKGKYKVLGILCISESLYKLRSSIGIPNNTVHKALLQNPHGNKVAYFIDAIDFGAGSKISLKKDKTTLLIRNEEYILLDKMEYKTDNILMEKILVRSSENNDVEKAG